MQHGAHLKAPLYIFVAWLCVHMLIKLTQNKEMFEYEFVNYLKLIWHEFYKLNCEDFGKFKGPTFDDFNGIGTLSDEGFPRNGPLSK
jgi:hypothetical protein